jgi:hypothetical protein
MHMKKGDKDLRETISIRNSACLVGPFRLSRQQDQAKAGSMLVAGRSGLNASNCGRAKDVLAHHARSPETGSRYMIRSNAQYEAL